MGKKCCALTYTDSYYDECTYSTTCTAKRNYFAFVHIRRKTHTFSCASSRMSSAESRYRTASELAHTSSVFQSCYATQTTGNRARLIAYHRFLAILTLLYSVCAAEIIKSKFFIRRNFKRMNFFHCPARISSK